MDIQKHLRIFPVPMKGNVLVKWMFRMDTQNILTKDPLTISSCLRGIPRYRWRTDKRKKLYLSKPLR